MIRFETVRAELAQNRSWRRSLILGLCLFGCTPLGEEGSTISRGDQAFAKGDLPEALAEYKLALRRGATDPGIYARVAHTNVGLNRIDEAREYYGLAVAADSSFADQAVADFVYLAREEEKVRDFFGLASAVQTARSFRPGISMQDLALPLARHYSDIGEYGRALPFFQKALSAIDPDSVPRILFETGVAYDEVGDCESALVYYDDYRERLHRTLRSEVNWRVGNCSFQLARIRREEGDDEEALRNLETLLGIGEPINLQAPGYFEKGEILGNRGECEAAIEAFQEVPIFDPSGNSPLVKRAEDRIDQIRFGGRFDRSPEPGQSSASCFSLIPGSDRARIIRRRGGNTLPSHRNPK
jgi:tetratricopeptide (TPR) repeat protein